MFQTQQLISKENESEEGFRKRASLALQKEIEDRYAKKIAQIQEKMGKSAEKVTDLEHKANSETVSTLISFGTTLMGTLFGKGVTKGTLSQAGSAFKKMGKVSKGSNDAKVASESYQTYQQQLGKLCSNKWLKRRSKPRILA